jgi:hypothetical protein
MRATTSGRLLCRGFDQFAGVALEPLQVSRAMTPSSWSRVAYVLMGSRCDQKA